MHDRVLPVLIFASLTLADPLASQATVSPADRVTLEGSSSTSYPLGRASMRLQQLLADLPKEGDDALRKRAERAYDRIVMERRKPSTRAPLTLPTAG